MEQRRLRLWVCFRCSACPGSNLRRADIPGDGAACLSRRQHARRVFRRPRGQGDRTTGPAILADGTPAVVLRATGQTDLRLHRQAVAGQRRGRRVDPARAQRIQPQHKGADADWCTGCGQGVDSRSGGFPVSSFDRSLGPQETAEQRAFVMLDQVGDGGALTGAILESIGTRVGQVVLDGSPLGFG